jgi:hypothetical protein
LISEASGLSVLPGVPESGRQFRKGIICRIKSIVIPIFFSILVFPLSGQEKELRYKSGLKINLSESAVISMVTVFPGDEIYSLFGHSSFRVLDRENMIDWMYNYGTFDFSDPYFVPRFIAGKLDYYVDVNSFRRSLRFYADYEKRRVFEQILFLDSMQRQKLFDFLQNNAEPDSRFYKYDFIRDNCSTRIAGALDRAIPGIADYSACKSTGESFRTMIRAYLSDRPFTDFGIQLALGRGADRIPDGNEVFFLPLPMMEAFSEARLAGSGEKLVVSESELAPSGRVYNRKGDYPLYLFMILLAFYAASNFILYRKGLPLQTARETGTDKGLTAEQGAVFICESSVLLLTGIAGIIIAYLWFFSDHTITASNLNLLWCNPLNLYVLYAKLAAGKKRSASASCSPVPQSAAGYAAAFNTALCALYLSAAGIFRAQAVLPSFLPAIAILIAAQRCFLPAYALRTNCK